MVGALRVLRAINAESSTVKGAEQIVTSEDLWIEGPCVNGRGAGERSWDKKRDSSILSSRPEQIITK